MQRFYILLAALSAFIGIFLIKGFDVNLGSTTKRFLVGLMALLFFWNLYQTFYFVNYGQKIVKGSDNSWVQSENIFFIANGLLPVHNYIRPGFFDPQLKNKLLDEKQMSISGYDNEQFVANECAKHLTQKTSLAGVNTYSKFPIQLTTANSQKILNLVPSARGHLLLCLEMQLRSAGMTANVIQSHRAVYTSIGAEEIVGTQNKLVFLPLFNATSEELPVYATLEMGENLKPQESGSATLKSFGLINYDPNKLPIHVSSTTPYKASVKTPTNNVYLQIFKEYFPGYKATVNGKDVPVLASKDKRMVLIPLKLKGNNEIELSYHGTPQMKLAFYINALAWLAVLFYFFYLVTRKYFLNERNG